MAFDMEKDSTQEKVNKLLVKCIELRKKLALGDAAIFAQLENKEADVKDKLVTAYDKLIREKATDLVHVKLYIEESLYSKGPYNFSCDREWTVQTTISKIVERFKSDACVDNVYILNGKSIAEKWATLRRCGVRQNDDILYVYVAQQKVEEAETFSSSDNSDSLPQEYHQLTLSDSGSIDTRNKDSSLPGSISSNSASTTYVQNITLSTDSVSFLPASNASTTLVISQNTTIHVDSNRGESAFITVLPQETQPTSAESTHKITSVPPPSTSSKTDSILNEKVNVGWTCSICTFINMPTRPGCEMCATSRPDNYKPPDDYVPSLSEQSRIEEAKKAEEMMKKAQEEKLKKKESERKDNYQQHLNAVEKNLTFSQKVIECSICLVDTDPGEAVCLADCLHTFCKDCMTSHITMSEEIPVKCPYVDDEYYCQSNLLEKEIRSLLPADKFQRYLSKSLASAEQKVPNSFHCRTANCDGWCVYDDGVNMFKCPACDATNCLTCKAIHENVNCKQYQEELAFKSSTDKQAKKTRKMLESLVKKKEAIHCPRCNIIILKKDGCDWLRCSMCGLEICWVTKLPRWGPNGKGDTSGGCHCRENGEKCHKDCVNCH